MPSDLVVSELVHHESERRGSAGDSDRLESPQGPPGLGHQPEGREFRPGSGSREGPCQPTEAEDALHIALAVVNGIEYLVTWNFRHIANAAIRSKIHGVCIAEGYDPCTICTPEELLEPESDA